jgi:plasmid stability protein
VAELTLKNLPEDLHSQLQREAAANLRSLEQEAQARLAQSFELTGRDQQWIDEAMASGPVSPLSRTDLEAVRDRVLGRRA